MEVFGQPSKYRGCFIAVPLSTEKGRGVTIAFTFGDWPREKSFTDPAVITGIQFTHREKVHLMECFGDVTYAYAFGNDTGKGAITLTYTTFLIGSGGQDHSEIFDRMAALYNNSRISKNPRYAVISLGNGVIIKGFVVGIDSATADAQHNLQSFNLHLLPVEVIGNF